jgi:hypothetical protein
MALNMRDPSQGADTPAPAHSYPIARTFAFTVIGALIGLFLLHHLVFSANVSGGLK